MSPFVVVLFVAFDPDDVGRVVVDDVDDVDVAGVADVTEVVEVAVLVRFDDDGVDVAGLELAERGRIALVLAWCRSVDGMFGWWVL